MHKVLCIKNIPRPITKKQLQSVLGLMGYYRSYIPHYADIALPLTSLTKHDAPQQLIWTKSQQIAFGKIKRRLSEAPILRTPDWNRPFILHTNASNFAAANRLVLRHIQLLDECFNLITIVV